MMEAERARLLRESPWEAQGLAEELYAMFSDDIDPFQAGSGIEVKYNPNAPKPAVDLINAPEDTPLYRVTRPNGDVFNINLRGGDIVIQQDGGQPQIIGVPRPTRTSATSFPGNLIAYNGSNSYTATIYPNGMTGATEDVSVTQLGGDATTPHAVDGSVWTTVIKFGNEYTMSLQVWQ